VIQTSSRRRKLETYQLDDDPLWYKDAIIYEVHVRAFYDTDGDGSGDFKGLIDKLPYLQELGVTTIWLLPFYPSPLRDDGYDIADYTDVNPMYGRLADARQFVSEAHRRGIRVINELVCAARPLRLERDQPEIPGRPDHLQGLRGFQLDLGPRGRRVLLAPLLLSST